MEEVISNPVRASSEPEMNADLREGFATFIEAARRLERSHAALKARADAVDVQLAATNKKLERTLQERETILSALPVGVIATDSDGEPTWSNPEGERLLEATIIAGVDLPRVLGHEIVADGLFLRLRRVELPDGGILLLAEDRSQVVRLERQVDRLDRLAGLSELALGIAHEIKNPLNGVMGFASLIQRAPDVESLRRYASKISAGMGRIDGIVKAMLAFAQPTEKIGRTAKISQIVREAASVAGVPAARIHFEGDGDAKTAAFALTTVLANLFRNSAEARTDGVAISVSATPGRDRLVLTVADDGPGIPGEFVSHVFEPFVSSKQQGHGLGLALSSRVMSYLGGSLELLDPGPPGATFRVVVPTDATAEEGADGDFGPAVAAPGG